MVFNVINLCVYDILVFCMCDYSHYACICICITLVLFFRVVDVINPCICNTSVNLPRVFEFHQPVLAILLHCTSGFLDVSQPIFGTTLYSLQACSCHSPMYLRLLYLISALSWDKPDHPGHGSDLLSTSLALRECAFSACIYNYIPHPRHVFISTLCIVKSAECSLAGFS